MSLIIKETSLILWSGVIKDAEKECSTSISTELELYLAHLLDRYSNQSDIANRVLATAYLEALQSKQRRREILLQVVGDECLLFAGLFPSQLEKKHVKADYFINLGRNAYQRISHEVNDLYWLLGSQFVLLADILQTIRREPALLPLEAYERWETTGSQRAYKMFLSYTKGSSFK